jgi:uridylate kinase
MHHHIWHVQICNSLQHVIIQFSGRNIIYHASASFNTFFSNRTSKSVYSKATKVDGVYDSDPKKNPNAKKFDTLKYIDVINRRLEVMDSTAITHCMENKIPILVVNLWDPDALLAALRGESVGTLVN